MISLVLEEDLVDAAGSVLYLAGLGREKDVPQALNSVTITYKGFSEALVVMAVRKVKR